MDKSIITECYVDSNLLETLVPSKTGYNKKNGCNNVAKHMKTHDGFALGIVDKDKNELDYLKEFEKIDEEGSLILWRHTKEDVHHYIIQIAPAIEKWMLRIVEELGLNMQTYELPSDFNGLCSYTKKRSSKKDPRLKELFKELKTRDHRNKEVTTLGSAIAR